MFTLREMVEAKNGSPLLQQEERLVKEPTVMRFIVTPAQATEWLNSNTRNRRVRQGKVDQYTRDMKAGRWDTALCDPIAFNSAGELLNGQHRLWAIVESGVTLSLYVQFNVPNETQLVMDGGALRRPEDYERIHHPDSGINHKHFGVANSMRAGLRGTIGAQALSRPELHDYVQRHKDAICFAVNLFPTHIKGVSTAPVMAVFARAYYSRPHDKLHACAEVLRTCMATEPHHQTMTNLLRWMRDTGSGGAGVMKQWYAKTARAVQAFCDGQKLAKIYEAESEPFPLPEEQAK